MFKGSGPNPMIIFAGVTLLSACSNTDANSTQETKLKKKVPICLDRFVVDIPVNVEIGASSGRLEDGYGVLGVHSNGTSVPKWSGIEVVETHPVESRSVLPIRSEVENLYKNKHSGLQGRDLDKRIAEVQQKMEKIPANQGFVYRDHLENDVLDLMREKLIATRPVEPKLSDTEYAYRTATEFHVGFHDSTDRRIRMFNGRPLRTDSGTAKEELDRMRTLYQTRAPTDIPTAPGFCTGFGFIHEPKGPEQWTDFETPFRSSAYPNLIFNLSIKPSRDNSRRGAPSSHGVLPYFANKAGLRVKKFHGPLEVTLAGSPARLFGMQYDSRCKEQPCMPLENAYELVVETYGEPGRPESPHITLKMVAALYDGHKAKLDYGPGREWMKKVYKPGLRGSSPPPFEVGLAVFESVVTSFRLRPGAIASKAPTAGINAPE